MYLCLYGLNMCLFDVSIGSCPIKEGFGDCTETSQASRGKAVLSACPFCMKHNISLVLCYYIYYIFS